MIADKKNMDWYEHFVNLEVTTPSISLKVADGNLLEKLGAVASQGINSEQFQKSPFKTEWDKLGFEERKNYVICRQNEMWENFSVNNWRIPLVVCLEGFPIGEVIIRAQGFRTAKTFSTASWITESHRGQGYGLETRVAALQLGFGALAAERALSTSFNDNEAAINLSRKLGYKLSGATLFVGGQKPPRRLMYYRLDRRMWESRIRRPDIKISDMCLPLSANSVGGGWR